MAIHNADGGNGIIKLPLLAKVGRLAAIPGQPDNVTYAVAWNACREPNRGFGYVVELLPLRRVRPIAWLSDDGKVYSCNGPLGDIEGRRPALSLARWEEYKDRGAIRVPNPDGSAHVTLVGEYRRTWDGKFVFVNPSRDPGRFFVARSWDMRFFLAVCWLTFVHIPQTQGVAAGVGGGRIVERMLKLLDNPLPDALDAMIWNGTTNERPVSGFERFAARQLVEAGASDVRGIVAEHDVKLIRLSTTSMFWLRFDDELNADCRSTLLAVEGVLNRLWYVTWAAEAADGGTGMLYAFDERFCAKASQGALREVSRAVGMVSAFGDVDNPCRTICGVSGRRGGAWDVMTRFAGICERIRLPFRLEYRFDVDVVNGRMVVRFAMPAPTMFPATRMGAEGWEDVRARRPAHAAAYAVRLSGVLAQAAFASSVGITTVDVTAHEGSLEGRPVLSFGFDRTPFVINTLPALKDGRCDDPGMDDDPFALMNILRPVRHSAMFAPDRGLVDIKPLPLASEFVIHRVPLWRDERPLPESLRALLCADTAAELDVQHEDAVVGSSDIAAIVRDNDNSPLVGTVQLEAVLAQLGEMGLDECGRMPLYCGHPVMRLLIGEADGREPDIPGIDVPVAANTRYWKIPDAVFDAHLWLGRFAQQSGEHERAIAEALQCLALAPSTPRAYVEVAVRYAEQGRYAQAAEMLISGLRIATMERDYLYMYYRLAYALWRLGRQDEAVACYGIVAGSASQPLADVARNEMNELLQSLGEIRPTMSVAESEQVLRAAGIPVAPTDSVLTTLAHAVIDLTDAGFPCAAADAAWVLSRHTSNGDVIGALQTSLRWGVSDVETMNDDEDAAVGEQ